MRVSNVPAILAAMALAACGALVWFIWSSYQLSRTASSIAPATPAPALKAIEKTTIAPPTVQVYAPRAKAKLKLPASVQADAAVHVLAASQVRADERPHTLITTLNESTGAVETVDRADPLPWLAPETRGEMGISYGLRDGTPMGRLSLRQNLVQIKSVRLGAVATLDQDGRWYAGVGAFYRW